MTNIAAPQMFFRNDKVRVRPLPGETMIAVGTVVDVTGDYVSVKWPAVERPETLPRTYVERVAS